MESLKDSWCAQTYQRLTPLGNKKSAVFLVMNKNTEKICVEKEISEKQVELYRQLQKIMHPNLPKILDIFMRKESWCVVEEYISGETLRERLEREKKLPAEKVKGFLAELCSVLYVLHGKGIVHRDINPNNIMITQDERLRLIDFDISRTVKNHQTADTEILGTAGYAAPEQFGFAQTDGRTDIYSLGILVNVMLTGKFPSESITRERPFEEIVKKCICMEPDMRWQSVREIQEILRRREEICSRQQSRESGWQGQGDRKQASAMPFPLSVIPGFRTGKPWKMLCAFLAYSSMLLLAVVIAVGELEEGTSRMDFVMLSLCMYYIPALIFSNVGYYDRKIKWFRNMNKWQKFAAKIGLVFLSMVILMVYILITTEPTAAL